VLAGPHEKKPALQPVPQVPVVPQAGVPLTHPSVLDPMQTPRPKVQEYVAVNCRVSLLSQL
jgi:hypothetical protein